MSSPFWCEAWPIPPNRGPKSPPWRRDRSPMPTRGAPGYAAASSSRTRSAVVTSRRFPKRRQPRLGDRRRTLSHVKKCAPSAGSCTPPTSDPAQGRPSDRDAGWAPARPDPSAAAPAIAATVYLHMPLPTVRQERRGRSTCEWHADRVERELAIRLRGAVKRYGPITAVDGLHLDVPMGTCVGLLGPNGAGKSTTMRLLTAQSIADDGEIEVLGFQLPEESKMARALCGVAPQLDNLDTTLTVEQNLLVFAHLYRIGRSERKDAIERALEMANLADRRDSRVDKLSGGMRRRLLIARALVHRPRLALLDEPTVGLDPQVRQGIWALIDRLRSEGTTILMSTHYIEEAQRLADSVLIMSHGQAVAFGRPAELVSEHAGDQALEVYGAPARLAEVEQEARTSGLRTRRPGTNVSILGADGFKRWEGERRPANLEDVFVL